jgi:hypothetical protein
MDWGSISALLGRGLARLFNAIKASGIRPENEGPRWMW